MGGAIFYFSQKIGLKSTKTCDFAYFTSQWGGLAYFTSPPRPPLATLLEVGYNTPHRRRAENTKRFGLASLSRYSGIRLINPPRDSRFWIQYAAALINGAF